MISSQLPLDDDLPVGEMPFDGTPEPTEICTEDEAERYLRRRRQILDDKAVLKMQYERIDREYDAKLKKLDWFWWHRVQAWATEQSRIRGKQTLNLMFGKLSLRKVRADIKFDKDKLEEAEAFAKKEDFLDLVSTPKLSATAYVTYAKERLSETGELIPGVEMTEERTTISASFPNKLVQEEE
jgi:hypothetical protein